MVADLNATQSKKGIVKELHDAVSAFTSEPTRPNLDLLLTLSRRILALQIGFRAHSLTAGELVKLAQERRDERLLETTALFASVERYSFLDQDLGSHPDIQNQVVSLSKILETYAL